VSEADLRQSIRDAARGDRHALEALLSEFGGRLHACALRITGDEFAAEEITHDALLALLRDADAFRMEASVATWLFAVTLNLSRAWLRRPANRRVVPGDPRGPFEPTLADADATRANTRRHLEDALQTLPPDMREVIALRFGAGLSYDEIALALACPSGSVASRLHRALARLGRVLTDRGLTAEAF
jgi:RNA polymerase sigma factor (sigma-70 family)